MCIFNINASYCKGNIARLSSSRQRNGYKIDVTMQNDNLQARHAKKRRTKQLSLGNGKAMELKLIKHDGALKELKEFRSAYTIEQHAYRAPYHLRAMDAKKKMMDRTSEYRK